MIKKLTTPYRGMSKGTSSDIQTDKYFDARNIRIIETDQKSSFALTNEDGNELIFSIPSPVVNTTTTSIDYTLSGNAKSLNYVTTSSVIPRCDIESQYVLSTNPTVVSTSGVQSIIGTKALRDSAIIVTTDNNGFDCFWELTNLNESNFDLNLLYMGNLGLSSNSLVQVLYNYENSIIQKIYFVDGEHQLRYLNIRQSVDNGDSINLIDVSPSSIDTVSTFTLSQPEITGVISGGSHTSGMIQYAYAPYILNGAQTTPSPLSKLVPIDKGLGLGGGEVNEILGKSVQLNISNIDSKFTNLKIYSIKYTSYNQIPEITIVADKQIDDFSSLIFTDDGSSVDSISLESFIFLGSNPIIPKHIVTKDNRLFPINIKEQLFDVPDLDMRAFSFDSGSNCSVINNAYIDSNGNAAGNASSVSAPNYNLFLTHDSINSNYDIYKFQSDGVTKGASGKYVKVEFLQTSLSDSESKDLQFLKDREIYRIGLKFYNRRGQSSDPKWIMDMKTPSGNLEGNYNQLKVTLSSDFYLWLNDSSNFNSEDDKPVGYKVLRADRTLNDQTIHSQGMINPMIANFSNGVNKRTSFATRQEAVDSEKSDKMPSMTRMFEDQLPFVQCQDYFELAWNNANDSTFEQLNAGPGQSYEGFKAKSSADWRAQNFQHNRLIQFFSPEIIFRDAQLDSSYKLNIVGLMEQDYVANWGTETNPINAENAIEAKFINGVSISTPGVTPQFITGAPWDLYDFSFFGPTNGENTMQTSQVYRQFQGAFKPATGIVEHDIYGSPELTQEGADFTPYNNDYKLRYANHLKTMRVDSWDRSDDARGKVAITGCNSIGAKCITFAEGSDDSSYPIESRKSIEQMYGEANITGAATKGILIAEFIKDSSASYVGGIYGGFSYEAKKGSAYIEIGTFSEINQSVNIIESPGDTFVNTFTFSKIAKDDLEVKVREFNIVSEIVSFRCESTVDLKNRDDLSLGVWDNRWQPKYDEYQKYNTVYSQQPTLIKSIGTGDKIKKIKEFDGRLMSSKEKIPGEFIDSWTDFLENEKMDLDGKYGPINAVVNIKDEIFCLQDTAVAHIAINPRVQINPQDGVALELGTGGILHDYVYKSTTLGCLNKWGVVTTENSFYFVDAINRGIMTFNGGSVSRLSDLKGFHQELLNTMDYESLRKDNPVLGNGVSVGYNPVNADVYFSFLQDGGTDFTLGFNEKIGQFTSYYDYVPAWYINKGSVLISSNPSNTEVWEHFKGVPNQFYGVSHKSSITFHVAPEGNEIIMNGASYKMELANQSGIELPNKGLTGVRVYNDYQDSGLVPLVLRQNVFKKFRNWKLNFPRNAGGRDRVRSSWGFAEFSFSNPDGNKLILHDITIFYTQH